MDGAAGRLDELLDPVLAPAYAFALSLARNQADAEDLVQEAALLATRHFATYEQGSNFRSWFLRIVLNVFRGRLRTARRRPVPVELGDAPELFLYGKAAELGLLGSHPDPAAAILGRIDGETVTAAIAALPEGYREVAALAFVEELSYPEIAAMLGIPVGTVRSRLHRARHRLQQLLWSHAVERGLVATAVPEPTA